jgi:uncharacterized protein YprB with RNaseH-like and TPR domain/ribosomal protein S27AE
MTNPTCPRCGSGSTIKNGSILATRGRVQRFLCHECGKRFHPSLRTQPLNLREGFLDIEASQLTASFGHVISWAIKERGEPTVHYDVLRHRSLKDEKRLLQSLLRTLKQFDLIYTFYGTNFDVPFLRTRCMYHNLPFPEYRELLHRDVYYMVRSRMNLHRKRLESVAEFLGIEGKTRVDPAVWVAASFGDKAALKYILEHNIADVKVLEAVYERVEPFVSPINRSI